MEHQVDQQFDRLRCEFALFELLDKGFGVRVILVLLFEDKVEAVLINEPLTNQEGDRRNKTKSNKSSNLEAIRHPHCV